jgi:predicted nucleotidyltransferase
MITEESSTMNENIVVRIEFGSHLYGTNTLQSDHDYKSVYIPPAIDILLQRVIGATGNRIKTIEGNKNKPEDIDDEAYSLQRYLYLLAEGQTVAVDMLFATKPLISTPVWDEIRANKNLLLTKHSTAFVKYCQAQAAKYGVKGSRVAAAKKAKEFFEIGVKNLGSTAKVEEVSSYMINIFDEHTTLITKETTPGKTETYFECCNRMVGFKNTLKEAASIYTRIYDEYGKRAKLAEKNENIDWKALSHAVRVANEAIELLSTSNVTFPLPNAKHILDIKLGKLSYKEVATEIEELLVQVEKASLVSNLRESADYEFINNLIVKVYKDTILLT